jgi:hypothetical protein
MTEHDQEERDVCAFGVWVRGWLETFAFVPARTAGKARAHVYREAREAGYESVTFQDVMVRRAPDLDDWARGQTRISHTSPEYIGPVAVASAQRLAAEIAHV